MTLYHQQKRAKLDLANLRLSYKPYRPYSFGYDEYSPEVSGENYQTCDYRIKTASTIASLDHYKRKSFTQFVSAFDGGNANGPLSNSQNEQAKPQLKKFSFGVRIEELRKLSMDSGNIKVLATVGANGFKDQIDTWNVDGFEPGFDEGSFGLVEANAHQDHMCSAIVATPDTKLQIQVLVLNNV
jgi:hypothetical protein